jgi:hypothetical protein
MELVNVFLQRAIFTIPASGEGSRLMAKLGRSLPLGVAMVFHGFSTLIIDLTLLVFFKRKGIVPA